MPKQTAQILGSKDTVELPEGIYDQPFNGPLVHECVTAELAARRQGTHQTRTRGMVSGGTSKPWRQKGTGRARAGTTRSPIWSGGGIVFGPSPRRYTSKVNRKARRAALRSALSAHAGRGSLRVLADDAFSKPSTKGASQLLGSLLDSSVLIVLSEDEVVAAKSFRNMKTVRVTTSTDVGLAELVGAATIVLSKPALGRFEELAVESKVRSTS